MAPTYDRRVSPELLHMLHRESGFARSLVRYARDGRWPLDLQFRSYAGKGDSWATLYMGLTKVLDLHHNSKGYWLYATPHVG